MEDAINVSFNQEVSDCLVRQDDNSELERSLDSELYQLEFETTGERPNISPTAHYLYRPILKHAAWEIKPDKESADDVRVWPNKINCHIELYTARYEVNENGEVVDLEAVVFYLYYDEDEEAFKLTNAKEPFKNSHELSEEMARTIVDVSIERSARLN